jgi:hypothetical protein
VGVKFGNALGDDMIGVLRSPVSLVQQSRPVAWWPNECLFSEDVFSVGHSDWLWE